ncbi:nucleoporin NUP42-like [Nerophis lumbriciformis]|uniref:nucleoporin NUP42-like n=1 Tax=Nerophis lumbriciformis TaxID=546530 RepID=UPI002ADFBC39|nr:nucleoporin NUP42-like [Nerophis lumbriciformis]
MTVCHFFLQGRCRYGNSCWNEHPGGGGGGGGGRGYNGPSSPPQSRGGGGFGNKVWVNPAQQKGGFNQQASSRGTDQWGGRGHDEKNFSSHNRFSTLADHNDYERGGRGKGGPSEEDDEQKVEIIQSDMAVWESSGQWGFSCYSASKASLSGFADLSPEELRLEYYSSKGSGDLKSYLNGINQLLSQWRNRVQELKIMNPSTRAALLAELKNPAPQASTNGFGSAPTGFGSSALNFGSKGFGAPAAQASTFSFTSPAAAASSPGFGSAIPAPTQPPSGFGSSFTAGSAAPAASSFSFACPSGNKPAASSSGFASAAGFSFSSSAAATNDNKAPFGGGFGSAAPAGNLFGQTRAAPAAAGASDGLFSPESDLTQEELGQFKAQRFTLGQVPLKPPPATMLQV